MDDVRVIGEVAPELAAIALHAANATGDDDVTPVTWEALRSAEIGTVWEAAGGGSMFSDRQTAELVYRTDEVAVLLVTRYYVQDGREPEVTRELRAFAFAAD